MGWKLFINAVSVVVRLLFVYDDVSLTVPIEPIDPWNNFWRLSFPLVDVPEPSVHPSGSRMNAREMFEFPFIVRSGMGCPEIPASPVDQEFATPVMSAYAAFAPASRPSQ